ncbi:SDR family NAD(P)-dependent oxidoreductase [Marinomonas fungiae]|uniref:NAD(P)-dependent dehydrogenase, short-chain alcohol dehydrogenase family n=1 Tax=Marinomonas fungiae TaxID=1137284 RepID=A0A0K6IQG7_9GAMM|nr:SDR family NAD(P)-dependent oxidoreductase [Marinomonas fungiae]CUB05355.1 NAD(P)-dependent dehydrogenase, short-chain alcohol dehydrogenase family [Marinomonas fungiae]
MPYTAIVVGAGSKIAQAIIEQLIEAPDCQQIIAISRQQTFSNEKVTSFNCEYTEACIEQLCSGLKLNYPVAFTFICQGILHQGELQPERKIEAISAENMRKVFEANTVIPSLWLKYLTPHLKSTEPCKVVLFSARIGSISDNQLGGWYSYRASKAALNMMVQTFSVELARRAKNIKLLAFHPGTTDTPLSEPFQGSVPEGKLFSPEFVAAQLLSLLDALEIDGKASYMDWNHQPISW